MVPQAQSLDQECEMQLRVSILMFWAPVLTGASVISWLSGDQLLVWFVAWFNGSCLHHEGYI